MTRFLYYQVHMDMGFVHQFNKLLLDTLMHIPNPFFLKPQREKSKSRFDRSNSQFSQFWGLIIKNHAPKVFNPLWSERVINLDIFVIFSLTVNTLNKFPFYIMIYYRN